MTDRVHSLRFHLLPTAAVAVLWLFPSCVDTTPP